jgi:hypothetical protein
VVHATIEVVLIARTGNIVGDVQTVVDDALETFVSVRGVDRLAPERAVAKFFLAHVPRAHLFTSLKGFRVTIGASNGRHTLSSGRVLRIPETSYRLCARFFVADTARAVGGDFAHCLATA